MSHTQDLAFKGFVGWDIVNAKALSIMRYQNDINTEHNMKSMGRAAVAQWTEHPTRTGQTRVVGKAQIFF